MRYYAKNSQEARSMLLDMHNGQQSYALTLHSCSCGDGFAISDPIDDSHKVVVCFTCKPRRTNIVTLLDNLSDDGFAYDLYHGLSLPMPAEYRLVSNTTEFTDKKHLYQDTAPYILKHAVMLADEDCFLLVLVDGDTITLNIAEI